MTRVLLLLSTTIAVATPCSAQMKVTVTGTKHDLTNVILYAPMNPGKDPIADTAVLADGTELPAGCYNRSVFWDFPANVFYLPKLKAGETMTVTLVNKLPEWKKQAFRW